MADGPNYGRPTFKKPTYMDSVKERVSDLFGGKAKKAGEDKLQKSIARAVGDDDADDSSKAGKNAGELGKPWDENFK